MVEFADLSDLRIRAQDAIATKHYDALLALSTLLRGDAAGMTLSTVPEWNWPTVTTTGSQISGLGVLCWLSTGSQQPPARPPVRSRRTSTAR